MTPPPLTPQRGRGGGGTMERTPTCAAVPVTDPSSRTTMVVTTTMIMTADTCNSCTCFRSTSCAVAINVVLIVVDGHNEAMRSFQILNEAMSSYPNATVLVPKDLHYPLPLCSMVYPDDNNDDNGWQQQEEQSKVQWG
jgi:hypothetical protein